MGLATVSSVAVSGALLKAGIPLDSKFGGVLQFRNHRPLQVRRANRVFRLFTVARRDIRCQQDDQRPGGGKLGRGQNTGSFS